MRKLLRTSGSMSSHHAILWLAGIYTLVFNGPFVVDAYRASLETPNTSVVMLIAIPLVVFALLHLVFSLALWPVIGKPLLWLVSCVSVFVVFAQVSFGVVFDDDMIRNIFETDISEAKSYLAFWPVLVTVTGCALVTVMATKLRINYRKPATEVLRRLGQNAVVFTVMAVTLYSCYAEFAATFRNNRYLKRELVPFEWVDSTLDYWAERLFPEDRSLLAIDEHPHLRDFPDVKKQHVTVVIVGETARSDHFQYNGYPRTTNRYTQPWQPVYFPDVVSCGTATAISVPCMFSDLDREHFDVKQARHRENALDVAQRSGAEVVWIDNNSSCKGVCERVPHRRISTDSANLLCDGDYCFDAVLLAELEQELANDRVPSKIIALHEIGSHGPTYYRRYPESFGEFVPDCPRSDIQNCEQDALVNTYDNTLLYSDYVHAEIIGLVDSQRERFHATVIYISDHGESLGDGGVYLHGLPYAFAPDEQTHVPLWIWSNSPKPDWRECLRRSHAEEEITQAYIFSTLLASAGVESSTRDVSRDLIGECLD